MYHKTLVVNLKNSEYDVYIGRKCYGLPESIWHNPFKIGEDGTRTEVIAKYREHVLGSPDLVKLLPSLRGKVLGCWCSPNHCHGDVLAELSDSTSFLEF
jgi:hypothetical protein